MDRKPVFDLVRRLLGRGFHQAEVERLDRALACAEGDASECAVSRPRTVGPAGIALVKRFEGCARRRPDGRIEAYPDPGSGGDPWTIGWGATGPGIGPGTVWTQDQCGARLQADLAHCAGEVAAALGDAPTTQQQFDALVSFHYNTGAIFRATLTRLHKDGNYRAAAREFGRWCRAGGRIMQGLARRRSAEAALYNASG